MAKNRRNRYLSQKLTQAVQMCLEARYRDSHIDWHPTNVICSALEAIFIRGLRKSGMIIVDVKQGYLPNYWPFIMNFAHPNVRAQISNLSQIKNDIGKARAWLRITLNDGLLENYITAIISEPMLSLKYYHQSSYICDIEELEILRSLSVSLNAVIFSAPVNCNILNMWTESPLRMAGYSYSHKHNYSQASFLIDRDSFVEPQINENDDTEEAESALDVEGLVDNHLESSSTVADSDTIFSDTASAYSVPNNLVPLVGGPTVVLARGIEESSVFGDANDSASVASSSVQPFYEPCSRLMIVGSSYRNSSRILSPSMLTYHQSSSLDDERLKSLLEDRCVLNSKNDVRSIPFTGTNAQQSSKQHNALSDVHFDVSHNDALIPDDLRTETLVSNSKVVVDVMTPLQTGCVERCDSSNILNQNSHNKENRQSTKIESDSIEKIDDSKEKFDVFAESFQTAIDKEIDNDSDEEVSVAYGNSLSGRSSWTAGGRIRRPRSIRNAIEAGVIVDSYSLPNSPNVICANNQKPIDNSFTSTIFRVLNDTVLNRLQLRRQSLPEIGSSSNVETTGPSTSSYSMGRPSETVSHGRINCVEIPVSTPNVDSDFVVVKKTVANIEPAEKSFRMSCLTKISHEIGLVEQDFKCFGCKRGIGLMLGPYRICEFDGRYYCYECHLNEESLIPIRILLNWDFKTQKVSRASKAFLDYIGDQPIFKLNEINPTLIDFVKKIAEVREMRIRLCYVSRYLLTCRDSMAEDFRKRAYPKNYLYENVDIYSLIDLKNVYNGQLQKQLIALLDHSIKHVLYKCRLCVSKGFICEGCSGRDLIYPFQLEIIKRCSKCHTLRHKLCAESAKQCPKCLRREAYISLTGDSGIDI